MKHQELSVIMDLMKDLQDKMEYGEDDFSERLGRKKPGIEVVKIEGRLPRPGMEHEEEMAGKDLDGDMEMGEDPAHAAMVMDEGEDDMEMPESPEEKLKNRLMKLRGV